jgi:hypothetical protein
MRRLTITVLVAGLFAGSLFASENNTMMGMDKEKCAVMHKSMHQDLKKDNASNELTTFEKHQKILNPERDELYGG